MADEPKIDKAAIDGAARSFAAARAKLMLPKSGNAAPPTPRNLKDKKARAKAVNDAAPARRLKKSGRTDLWGIRCKPKVKEDCRAIARERGMQYDEWAEEVFLAAIAAHAATKLNGGTDDR